jgi:hypothetical protein
MSSFRPYILLDEDNESWNNGDGDIELLDYGTSLLPISM